MTLPDSLCSILDSYQSRQPERLTSRARRPLLRS